MRVTFVAERLNWGRVLGIGVAYVLACFVVLISGERNKDSFFFHFFFSLKDIEMYFFFFEGDFKVFEYCNISRIGKKENLTNFN